MGGREVTALLPNVGIGSVHFGDSNARATDYFGDGIALENFFKNGRSSLHFEEAGLLHYFNADDQLETIIVDGDSDVFTLMGKPLRHIFGDSPPYSARVSEWITGNHFPIEPPPFSLGCSDYGVTPLNLSFALPEEGTPTLHLTVPKQKECND